MGEYAQSTNRSELPPQQAYEHAHYLLESESELVSSFQKLIDGQMRLANISDSHQLALEQMQIYNVVDLFQMSLREPSLLPIFRYCYYCWKGGLSLTRAKKGRERGLQAMVGATQAPTESEGFGSPLSSADDAEESKFFSKLAGIRPKGRSINDF
jgi:hypothetical protein